MKQIKANYQIKYLHYNYCSRKKAMPKDQETSGFGTEEDHQVCEIQGCTNLFTSNQEIFNITFFQFFGMALFSYCVIAYNGIITFPGVWVVQTGMFFSLVFAGTFGCGHLNPALTLACVVRKQNRLHPAIGLYYWFIQYSAAFAGTFVAWAYSNTLIAPFPDVHTTTQATWITFFREVLGSFLFIFAVLIMISSDTTFTKNNFQTWFCVPLCLIAVCKVFNLGLGTNPAQAIAFQVAYYALNPTDPFATKQLQLQCIWSVVVGSTIGGLMAGVIFEFIYRPYTKVYRQQLIEMGEGRRGLKVAILNKSENSQRNHRKRTTDIELN